MNLETLAAGIGLQREVLDQVWNFRQQKQWKSLETYVRELTVSASAKHAYEQLCSHLKGNDMGLLACYLEAAVLVHDRYRQKQIPDSVYFDTMACFSRFLEETRREKGCWCFDRGFWTYRQTSMMLFRVGALEFEICPDEKEISLHIPSGACFDSASVDRSLVQGCDFIRRFYQECCGYSMTCESWLLSPELGKLLMPGSNILAFQNRFSILSVYPERTEFMQWLFDVPTDAAFTSLPEDTSLRRKVKAFLLSGGNIGEAKGILKETLS